MTRFTDYKTINLWENKDQTDINILYTPMNNIKISSKEHALQIIETEKTTLTKYPLNSRPVLTKKTFMETNAITGRLGSRGVYRKIKPDLNIMFQNFCKAYFTHDY